MVQLAKSEQRLDSKGKAEELAPEVTGEHLTPLVSLAISDPVQAERRSRSAASKITDIVRDPSLSPNRQAAEIGVTLAKALDTKAEIREPDKDGGLLGLGERRGIWKLFSPNGELDSTIKHLVAVLTLNDSFPDGCEGLTLGKQGASIAAVSLPTTRKTFFEEAERALGLNVKDRVAGTIHNEATHQIVMSQIKESSNPLFITEDFAASYRLRGPGLESPIRFKSALAVGEFLSDVAGVDRYPGDIARIVSNSITSGREVNYRSSEDFVMAQIARYLEQSGDGGLTLVKALRLSKSDNIGATTMICQALGRDGAEYVRRKLMDAGSQIVRDVTASNAR